MKILILVSLILTLKENMDVHVRRAAILCALPAYLQEDDSNFLKTWDVSVALFDYQQSHIAIQMSAWFKFHVFN